jgi:hypothetical protein
LAADRCERRAGHVRRDDGSVLGAEVGRHRPAIRSVDSPKGMCDRFRACQAAPAGVR